MLRLQYQQKKMAAEARNTPGPRKMARRMALRGHLYQSDELTSLIASAEHANGGPHWVSARSIQTRDGIDIAKIFRDALAAAKQASGEQERDVAAVSAGEEVEPEEQEAEDVEGGAEGYASSDSSSSSSDDCDGAGF